MAYRQPRPPQPRGEDATGNFAALHRFLREFCSAAWDADRRRDAQLERLEARIARLEAQARGKET